VIRDKKKQKFYEGTLGEHTRALPRFEKEEDPLNILFFLNRNIRDGWNKGK
jgi:hypothetical protein